MQFKDLDLERRNPRTVVAVILGGGAGTRLFPLTKQRAKPAVSANNHFMHLIFSSSSIQYHLFLCAL